MYGFAAFGLVPFGGIGEPSVGLYSVMDEDPANDADYAQSSIIVTDTDTMDIQLSPAVDPGVHTNHVFAYRYRKLAVLGTRQINLTVTLFSGATQIAQWVHTDIGTSWVTSTQTLTSGEAASIADYADMWFRIEADGV